MMTDYVLLSPLMVSLVNKSLLLLLADGVA